MKNQNIRSEEKFTKYMNEKNIKNAKKKHFPVSKSQPDINVLTPDEILVNNFNVEELRNVL